MESVKCFLVLGLCLLTTVPVYSQDVFTPEELDRVKSTLNQMVGVVEGLHEEALEMDSVLNASNTAMRKARVKERLDVRLKDMQDRLKDLRRLRLTFIKVPRLKEFMIALDDRIRVMEQNASLMREIHLPQALQTKAMDGDEPEFPTFINQGDPRYQLEHDQQRLAEAIDRGGHLLDMRDAALRDDENFKGFVKSLDKSLKSTNKPERQTVPALGRQTLDEFHNQLTEAREKDPTFDWNEDRNDRQFRKFLQGVEHLDQEAMKNVRVVSNHPRVDEPNLAQSRQTFAKLMRNMDEQERTRQKKRVVMKSAGERKPIRGMNRWLNDIRLDTHKPARQEFSGFLDSLEPIQSEIVMKASKVPARTTQSPVVDSISSEEFLGRLSSKRSHQELSVADAEKTMHAVHVKDEGVRFPFHPEEFQEHQEMVVEYMSEASGPARPLKPESGAPMDPKSTGTPSVMQPKGQFDTFVSGMQGGPAHPKLVSHKLEDEKSLIPITLTLLDQDRVPYSETPVTFELDLSEIPWDVSLLESMSRNPKRHGTATNAQGEAQVHLLAKLPQSQKVRVEKVVSQSSGQVVCRLKVIRDGKE